MPFPFEEKLRQWNDRLTRATDSSEIEASLAELESIAKVLREIENPSPALRAELIAFQHELRRTAGIIDSGCILQTNWANVLGAMAGGYTVGGESVPLAMPRQVSLQG